MIDYDKIIELCDGRITEVLERLNVEYRTEQSWVCLRCPFHNGDKFNLKYRNGSFYCFSECRRIYNIIEVVAKIEDVEYDEAALWLARFVGLSEESIELKRDENLAESQKVINQYKLLKNRKSDIPPVSQECLNDIQFPYYDRYIAGWGISRNTAKIFNLGLGLNNSLSGRICFPIDAPDGQIVSVSGRLPNAEEVNMPKYYIIGDTNAKSTLYNISRAYDVAKNLGFIIIVEGMKSVLFMYENGHRNVVGAIGASLTDEQAKILLRLGCPIIVCGDNDLAGLRLEQSVYNKLSRYLNVHRLNIGMCTDKKKASVDDLDFDEYLEFEERLMEIAKQVNS